MWGVEWDEEGVMGDEAIWMEKMERLLEEVREEEPRSLREVARVLEDEARLTSERERALMELVVNPSPVAGRILGRRAVPLRGGREGFALMVAKGWRARMWERSTG